MNTLVWGVSWGVVGWLLGILLLFVGGLLFLPFSAERRNRVANYYSKLAMKLIGSAALVESGTKYDIYRSEKAADDNAHTVSIDGKEAHVTNETGLLSTLHKKPFGMVPPPEDNVSVYVSPGLAEFGAIETERREKDNLVDKDGAYKETVSVPTRRPTVRLREFASAMIPGTRSLWDLRETVELYKQSQSMFGDSKTTQFMIVIVAYSIGALLTWLIVTNAGGAVPDTSISLPMVVVP
jgi:hypothetical protein